MKNRKSYDLRNLEREIRGFRNELRISIVGFSIINVLLWLALNLNIERI